MTINHPVIAFVGVNPGYGSAEYNSADAVAMVQSALADSAPVADYFAGLMLYDRAPNGGEPVAVMAHNAMLPYDDYDLMRVTLQQVSLPVVTPASIDCVGVQGGRSKAIIVKLDHEHNDVAKVAELWEAELVKNQCLACAIYTDNEGAVWMHFAAVPKYTPAEKLPEWIIAVNAALENAGLGGMITEMPITYHSFRTDAEHLATRLHHGQVDQTSHNYIDHPRRVHGNLLRIKPHASDDQKNAAWLHDTIEDCDIDGAYLLARGYSQACVDMVQAVTKPDDDKRSYEQVITDLIDTGNVDAMQIKIADLMDNLHPQRRAEWAKQNPASAEESGIKYNAAIQRLATAAGISMQVITAAIQNSPTLNLG